jgi:hypothetical protein
MGAANRGRPGRVQAAPEGRAAARGAERGQAGQEGGGNPPIPSTRQWAIREAQAHLPFQFY